ncbi:MAG: polyhydroxyalkanoate depolymerase [Burkholderiales bacterium]
MLYTLHEWQHAMLAPMNALARTHKDIFSHPFSPLAYHPLSNNIAAGADLLHRVTARYEKPAWEIEHTFIDGSEVPVELQVADATPFCKLIHFRRAATRDDPRVLVVAPLSGHFATLLRDTVRSLLPEHDVWVTDWVDAKMVPATHGPWHLDNYVDTVRRFIRHLGNDLHVMSVCQPTVPVLAAISLMAADDETVKPRTMTMMGGPIDARRSPGAFNSLAVKHPISWFERRMIQRVPGKYPGAMRRVYPGFLQYAGFVAMNPSRHAGAHWEYYSHLVAGDGDSAQAHRRFYDEYNAVLDVPAEYYLDTVKTVFQEFALPNGTMRMCGQAVRPDAIRKTALLTIEGELDDISGSGQTQAAHALCTGISPNRREHFTAPRVGHYGIFSGRKWREVIYPRVRDFIWRHP